LKARKGNTEAVSYYYINVKLQNKDADGKDIIFSFNTLTSLQDAVICPLSCAGLLSLFVSALKCRDKCYGSNWS